MTRTAVLISMATLALSVPATAQEAEQGAWHRLVHVGKWILAGATVALGAYALSENRAADREYDALRVRCDGEPALCVVNEGRYVDVNTEAAYRRAIVHDRRARTGIIAAQVTLLGSAALFLYDLRDDRGPDNIPFPSPQRSLLSSRSLVIGARIPLGQ
jgi:hypothetical protein